MEVLHRRFAWSESRACSSAGHESAFHCLRFYAAHLGQVHKVLELGTQFSGDLNIFILDQTYKLDKNFLEKNAVPPGMK